MTFIPTNAVCYMIDDRGYQGSGFLISDRHMLTASHMVYDAAVGGASGRERTGIKIIPANNPSLGTFSVASKFYNPVNDYDDQENYVQMGSDFAVIRLDRPHGLGWFGIDPTMGPPGLYYTLAGFPAGRAGQMAVQPNTRFTGASPAPNVLSSPQYQEAPGSSGGPAYLNEYSDIWNAVALYVGQLDSNVYHCQLSPDTENQIEQWMATDGFSPFVTRCYHALLGRAPDDGGINNWSATLLSQGPAAVLFGFVYSDEFIGGNPNISNEDFVTKLYTAFLNRDPDPDGFSNWVAALNSGTAKEQVAVGFAASMEAIVTCGRYGQS